MAKEAYVYERVLNYLLAKASERLRPKRLPSYIKSDLPWEKRKVEVKSSIVEISFKEAVSRRAVERILQRLRREGLVKDEYDGTKAPRRHLFWIESVTPIFLEKFFLTKFRELSSSGELKVENPLIFNASMMLSFELMGKSDSTDDILKDRTFLDLFLLNDYWNELERTFKNRHFRPTFVSYCPIRVYGTTDDRTGEIISENQRCKKCFSSLFYVFDSKNKKKKLRSFCQNKFCSYNAEFNLEKWNSEFVLERPYFGSVVFCEVKK